MKKLLILGTGAYASALANNFYENFDVVNLYGIDEFEINDINENKMNSKYFPDIKFLSEDLFATNDIEIALKDATHILISLPTGVIKNVIEKKILPHLKTKVYWINASKGFIPGYSLENDFLLSIIPNEVSNGIYKIIGGTFAIEMMRNMPSFLTLTSDQEICNEDLLKRFNSQKVFTTWNDDYVAINLFSIFKNIYAIAQGMLEGLGYEKNTQTFFMMKSLKELTGIYEELTNKKLLSSTLITSALLGDFILTGTSKTSRNFTFGYSLISKSVEEAFVQNKTIEGAISLKELLLSYPKIIEKHSLLNILNKVIYKNKNPIDEFNKVLINDKNH